MKNWKCPCCANRHQTEDDIIFSVCKGCLSEMKVVEDKEVEDNGV